MFLPPVERAVPQATEVFADGTEFVVEYVEDDVPESPSSPQAVRSSPDPEGSLPTSGTDEIQTLRLSLETAQSTIRNLRETLERVQSEANVVSTPTFFTLFAVF